MALSAIAASSARSFMCVAKTLGTVSGRAFATGTEASQTPEPPKRPSSIVEPTYTYMPPGSSMREPLYFSTSDPVYFVDPKPESQAPSTPTPPPASDAKAKAPEGPGAPTTVKKVDFSAISGKHGDDGKPVSYRMVDDLSQQGYVVNPNTHSMREPKYVSVSDPKYPPADKPADK